jgi:hypothetical protein
MGSKAGLTITKKVHDGSNSGARKVAAGCAGARGGRLLLLLRDAITNLK